MEQDKITGEEFKAAIESVLLAKPKVKSENRMPSKEDLGLRWKLTGK